MSAAAARGRLSAAGWLKRRPSSLLEAMELCKDHARERLGMSVDRIADAIGLADRFTLYRWLSTGRMPANMVRPYERACGIDYITRWLVANDGKMIIDIPTGRRLKSADVSELHSGFAEAVQLLSAVYDGKSSPEDTVQALTAHLAAVAWHRANVAHLAAPELDFGPAD